MTNVKLTNHFDVICLRVSMYTIATVARIIDYYVYKPMAKVDLVTRKEVTDLGERYRIIETPSGCVPTELFRGNGPHAHYFFPGFFSPNYLDAKDHPMSYWDYTRIGLQGQYTSDDRPTIGTSSQPGITHQQIKRDGGKTKRNIGDHPEAFVSVLDYFAGEMPVGIRKIYLHFHSLGCQGGLLAGGKKFGTHMSLLNGWCDNHNINPENVELVFHHLAAQANKDLIPRIWALLPLKMTGRSIGGKAGIFAQQFVLSQLKRECRMFDDGYFRNAAKLCDPETTQRHLMSLLDEFQYVELLEQCQVNGFRTNLIYSPNDGMVNTNRVLEFGERIRRLRNGTVISLSQRSSHTEHRNPSSTEVVGAIMKIVRDTSVEGEVYRK